MSFFGKKKNQITALELTPIATQLEALDTSDFEIAVSEPKRQPCIDLAKLEALKAADPYRVTERLPDYLQVLTGWRAWKPFYGNEGLRLQSLGRDHVWTPKQKLEARCTSGGFYSGRIVMRASGMMMPSFAAETSDHRAPSFNCECGVWAFKSLDLLRETVADYEMQIVILGQVSLWGRVVETENGYRAQYAYPSELWLFSQDHEELGYIYDVPVRTIVDPK